MRGFMTSIVLIEQVFRALVATTRGWPLIVLSKHMLCSANCVRRISLRSLGEGRGESLRWGGAPNYVDFVG